MSQFATRVSVGDGNFTPTQLIEYKEKFGCFPEKQKILVYLSDEIVKKLDISKIYDVNKQTAIIQFSDIYKNWKSVSNVIIKCAMEAVLSNITVYKLTENDIKGIFRAYNMDKLAKEKAGQMQYSVDLRTTENIEKILYFIVFKILDLNSQFSIKFVREYIDDDFDAEILDIKKYKIASDELDVYENTIKHLLNWIMTHTNKNFVNEVLMIDPEIDDFSPLNHFIREYLEYLVKETDANYAFVDFGKWDGKKYKMDVVTNRLTNAMQKLKQRHKSKTLLYEKMYMDSYVRRINEIFWKKGQRIIIQGMFGNKHDVYLCYNLGRLTNEQLDMEMKKINASK